MAIDLNVTFCEQINKERKKEKDLGYPWEQEVTADEWVPIFIVLIMSRWLLWRHNTATDSRETIRWTSFCFVSYQIDKTRSTTPKLQLSRLSKTVWSIMSNAALISIETRSFGLPRQMRSRFAQAKAVKLSQWSIPGGKWIHICWNLEMR